MDVSPIQRVAAQASGAIWAADEAQMWNPEVRAELPSDSDAMWGTISPRPDR